MQKIVSKTKKKLIEERRKYCRKVENIKFYSLEPEEELPEVAPAELFRLRRRRRFFFSPFTGEETTLGEGEGKGETKGEAEKSGLSK